MNTSSTKYYAKYLLGGASAIAIATSSMVASAQEGDAAQDAAQDNDSGGIETIIVTATKRAMNVQDIPASVQAITGAQIAEMGAHNAEDYTRFVPSVSFVSSTPGANNIIFRGINTSLGSYISQAGASFYLDETSLTSTGSQPDVRMLDIAGVEALAGPQGTLYGDSAQAGILRVTTNKPQMNEFDAILEAGMRTGAESAMSWDVSGIFNIPLVEDKLAVRFVAEKARDGGFISNVLGNTPDGVAGNDYFTAYFPEWGTENNADIVEDNWNGVDYLTGRFSAKLNLNEDWSATFSMTHQENKINGGNNAYNPFVGDLQTVDFNKRIREDKWDLYNLTLDGDLGWAQVVSSTSFYKRKITGINDVTVYTKYWAAIYCAPGAVYATYCTGPELGSDVKSTSSYPEDQQKFTQEIRFSGQTDNFDWLVGGYFEDSSVAWEGVFNAPTNYDYQNSKSLAYLEYANGEEFPRATGAWGSNSSTDWSQIAAFGESTWHITDQLHLTLGARWFHRKNSTIYASSQPNLLNEARTSAVTQEGSDKDFIPKVSLAYDITDDNMVYALYTKGFRPGGTNRSKGNLDNLVFPTIYRGDVVTNYEFGSKNRFFDNMVQLNLTYYYMKWDDFQLQMVDPSSQACETPGQLFCDEPWQSVVANSPGGAHTEGMEVDFIVAPTDGLKIGGNLSHITAVTDGDFESLDFTISEGTQLPNTPKWKGSLWSSYFWPVEFVSGGEMFIRGQYTYKGENDNKMIPHDAAIILTNKSYGIADISAGLLAHDAGWELSFYANNITDKRAQYNNPTGQFEYYNSNSGANGGAPYSNYHSVITNRPREFGVRLKWMYGG